MRTSLQSKIASAMWLMTAISTLFAALITGALLVASHQEAIRQQLQATATSLVSLGITNFSELKDFGELNRFVEDALQMDRVDKIIRVYDSDKRLIFTTAGLDYDILPERLDQTLKKPVFITFEGKHRRYESLVIPYEGARNKKTFYLQVAIPISRYSEMLGYLWWQSILMMALLVSVSIGLSYWLSKKLLKPVELIANHLKKMDPKNIEDWKPINLDPKGVYLNAIADGINSLVDRTRASMMQLKKMGRYVAHEMRTPLTIMQGEAETALMSKDTNVSDYETVLRSSLEEIQRMSEIVTTVLEIGDESHVAPLHQPVELGLTNWIRENKRSWERVLEREIAFNAENIGRDIIIVDPKLLMRLIDNLVRNIKKHTPPSAKCAMRIVNDGDDIKLKIFDNGPGLAQQVLDSLNEEGRLSEAAGVGLNLCYRIAEISNINLHFSNISKGGLEVTIGFG